MDKWADYLISAVRYESDGSPIDQVRVHKDNGDTVGESSIWKRESVVSSLKADNTFVTIYWDGENWTKGEPVGIYRLNGVDYIRTKADNQKVDNLGEIPEF